MPRKPLVAVWRDAVRDSDLDRTAKLVAYTLSTYVNRFGRAWPSRSSLAKGSSLTDRAVDCAVRTLESSGWLLVQRTKGGKNSTNTYLIQLSPTANDIRRSEWQTANLTPPTANLTPLNSEPCSHESAESAESGATSADAAGSGAARALPEDHCGRCSQRLPLPDDIHCAGCLAQLAKASP